MLTVHMITTIIKASLLHVCHLALQRMESFIRQKTYCMLIFYCFLGKPSQNVTY